MHHRKDNLTHLRDFATSVAPSIYRVIAAREAGYRLFGWIKKNDGQHCRAVVFAVDDDVLAQHGIVRAGAFIRVAPDDEVSHAYFAHEADQTLVLDFCASYLAVCKGDSINNWRRGHPRLFHEKALLGTKQDIARNLHLEYPRRNTGFWEHFNSR